MSEAGFLVMDLEDRNRRDLAWRFLNRYLEASGDYAGLGVLRFYLVYRALVRAKIHLMRSHQAQVTQPEKLRIARAFNGYLRLAKGYAARRRAALVLAHGPSGCGKTTITGPLVEQLGAVRLRSDIERKRLHGLAPLAASGSGTGNGLYTRAATAAVYRRLGELSLTALEAGFPVVVDAACLRRSEREALHAIARQLDVPFLILNVQAPQNVLRTRVAQRQARADDASEADLAVLERQLAIREPLTPAEHAAAIEVDGTLLPSPQTWQRIAERLFATAPHPG
jgi:hypothetical protein